MLITAGSLLVWFNNSEKQVFDPKVIIVINIPYSYY